MTNKRTSKRRSGKAKMRRPNKNDEEVVVNEIGPNNWTQFQIVRRWSRLSGGGERRVRPRRKRVSGWRWRWVANDRQTKANETNRAIEVDLNCIDSRSIWFGSILLLGRGEKSTFEASPAQTSWWTRSADADSLGVAVFEAKNSNLEASSNLKVMTQQERTLNFFIFFGC